MTRVLVLGAGFGGLELSTMCSQALGEDVEVTLIDKNDAFVFGYSKLDVMFARSTPQAIRLPYADMLKPGVRLAPFKCPPAPSEAALLLHDYLSTRGVRGGVELTFVIPFENPVPPSPETSRALLAAFRGA